MKNSIKIITILLVVFFAAGLFAQSKGKIIGSTKAKKFHTEECQAVKKIAKENLIEFKSIEDAKAQGYEACKICKPGMVKEAKKEAAKGTDKAKKEAAETKKETLKEIKETKEDAAKEVKDLKNKALDVKKEAVKDVKDLKNKALDVKKEAAKDVKDIKKKAQDAKAKKDADKTKKEVVKDYKDLK